MLGDFTGFAVFDLETTGIAVSRHHRIIEIGVVRLDEDLDIVEEWETLINPSRDIGAGDIHGITASDLRDAPSFADLLADIWQVAIAARGRPRQAPQFLAASGSRPSTLYPPPRPLPIDAQNSRRLLIIYARIQGKNEPYPERRVLIIYGNYSLQSREPRNRDGK